MNDKDGIFTIIMRSMTVNVEIETTKTTIRSNGSSQIGDSCLFYIELQLRFVVDAAAAAAVSITVIVVIDRLFFRLFFFVTNTN